MAGRPALYKDPESLQEAIDDYFNNGIATKTVIVGKGANAMQVVLQVPTITGLALYLGFESRQSFYDYEEMPGFSYTIKKARLRIEMAYEEALHTPTCAGAIFALKNMGWRDKQEVEHSGQQGVNLNILMPDGD